MSSEQSGSGTRLLEEVREVLRRNHYSIHTERIYCEWVRRFVRFHGMTSRADLAGGEGKIEAFLTHLAVQGNVAPSTQNQAMNALVFLYRKVLKVELAGRIDAARSVKEARVPVVGGGAAHSALDRGDGRPGHAIAVRERIADYGVCSVASAGRGFCVPADYGTIRKLEQGSGARSTPRPLGGRPGRAWNLRGRAAGHPFQGRRGQPHLRKAVACQSPLVGRGQSAGSLRWCRRGPPSSMLSYITRRVTASWVCSRTAMASALGISRPPRSFFSPVASV